MTATARYGSLPFAEAIAFLRDKLDIPTERWNDLWQSAHDRGFMVAGATKADLLADLHAAVLKAREQGTTLAEFRKDFEVLVARHGWTGWTGEDTPAGRAWRTRTIYETNLRASYQAGRYAQMTDPAVLKWRPFWRYKHSDSVRVPRPHHLAWNGLVLRADDPWWRTHYPPNGWGCKCRVFALSKEDLKKLGKDGPDPTPDDGFYEWVDKKSGEIHLVPKGIDPGWDYAPGRTWFPDLNRYPYEIAKGLVAANLRDGVFERWLGRIGQQIAEVRTQSIYAGLAGQSLSDQLRRELAKGERQAVAVLDDRGILALEASSQAVYLSDDTVIKQIIHREGQEWPIDAYARLQRAIDEAEWVDDSGQNRLVYFHFEGDLMVAAIKVSADKGDNWLLSLRRGNERELKAAIEKGSVKRW